MCSLDWIYLRHFYTFTMVCRADTSLHTIWDHLWSFLLCTLFGVFFFFFFSLFIFIERYLLYRILLFSVKPQHESAIGIHMSPPFWTSLPFPSPSQPLRLTKSLFQFPEPYNKFPLDIYFTYGSVSFLDTLSKHLTFSSSLPMSISLFFMCVSLLLPCK